MSQPSGESLKRTSPATEPKSHLDSPSELDDRLLASLESTAVRAVRGAGRILSEHFGTELSVDYKDEAKRDPVTAVDRECQEFVAKAITEEYPDHGIVGEEDADPDQQGLAAADITWVVDPLDGTRNFMSGLPVYACSICVLNKGEPVAGAVYIPWPGQAEGRVVHARRGGGAFVEGEAVSVFEGDEPDGSRLMTLPASFAGTYRFQKPARRKTGDFRITGSIAFELAMTATGTFQYSLAAVPRLWDVAAGALLVTEAGGVVMAARKPPGGTIRKTRIQWDELRSFFAWESGKTTVEELREWSRPLVLGNPKIALFVTENLRRRVPLRRRLRW